MLNREIPTTPPEEEVVVQETSEVAEDEVEDSETWDPEHLTLDQIARVKYQPLGGKG